MIAVRTITETAVCRTLHFVLDMFACTLRGSMIGLFGGTKHPVPLTKSALLILVNVLAEFFARCSFDGSLSQEVLSHNLHKEVIIVTSTYIPILHPLPQLCSIYHATSDPARTTQRFYWISNQIINLELT